MQPWEESAVKNGFKFIIATGQDRESEFEIIAVSKRYCDSINIANDLYDQMDNGLIVICSIETQKLVNVLQC